MPAPLPPVRRIVTATNAAGRSYIMHDGESPAVLTMEQRPGYRNSNLWCTLGAEASVDAPDTISQHQGVLPPQGGTVFRIIDIPPESKDPEERRRLTAAVFAAMFADATRDEQAQQGRHPGMHLTDTVDYAIVLQGELVAIMDEDETVMRAKRARHDHRHARRPLGPISPGPLVANRAASNVSSYEASVVLAAPGSVPAVRTTLPMRWPVST